MIQHLEFCPECNLKLSQGWLGERGYWYDSPNKVRTISGFGECLLGGTGNKEAKRCFKCGLVVFKSEPVGTTSNIFRNLRNLLPMILVFLLGITIILAITYYYVGTSPEMPDKIKILEQVSPREGFRYFSGYYTALNNHPSIYAHGSGEGQMVTVIGNGTEMKFRIKQLGNALSEYKKLLKEKGYH
jgi:hypothetical protein